jgi:hypothetical protein
VGRPYSCVRHARITPSSFAMCLTSRTLATTSARLQSCANCTLSRGGAVVGRGAYTNAEDRNRGVVMVPRIPSTSSRGRWAAVMLLACLFAAGRGGNHGSSTGSSTSASGAPTTGATGAKTFGTLPSPCGAGTAKGATANGVTDTSIGTRSPSSCAAGCCARSTSSAALSTKCGWSGAPPGAALWSGSGGSREQSADGAELRRAQPSGVGAELRRAQPSGVGAEGAVSRVRMERSSAGRSPLEWERREP